jgi:hypothetical protein
LGRAYNRRRSEEISSDAHDVSRHRSASIKASAFTESTGFMLRSPPPGRRTVGIFEKSFGGSDSSLLARRVKGTYRHFSEEELAYAPGSRKGRPCPLLVVYSVSAFMDCELLPKGCQGWCETFHSLLELCDGFFHMKQVPFLPHHLQP